MIRIIKAMPGIPIVKDGIIILLSKIPPHPEHGTKSVFKHPSHNNAGIVIIIGIDMKNRDIVTIKGSIQVPCLCAIKNPRGSPIDTLISRAKKLNFADTINLGKINVETGLPLYLRLSPKSPWIALEI